MSRPRPDPALLDTWRSFLIAHAALRNRLEDELVAAHGLTLSWYEVLLRLDCTPGGRLRMNDLVSCALMTKSGVTRLADRMEAEGLIRRDTCPSDRRGAFAVLTDEGRRRLRRAAPTHLAGIQEHFGRHLSPEEAATLDDALTRIRDALGTDGAPARSCGEGASQPAAARH